MNLLFGARSLNELTFDSFMKWKRTALVRQYCLLQTLQTQFLKRVSDRHVVFQIQRARSGVVVGMVGRCIQVFGSCKGRRTHSESSREGTLSLPHSVKRVFRRAKSAQ